MIKIVQKSHEKGIFVQQTPKFKIRCRLEEAKTPLETNVFESCTDVKAK